MNFDKILKKYCTIILVSLILEASLGYYLHNTLFDDFLLDKVKLLEKSKENHALSMMIGYVINSAIAIVAFVDLQKIKSKFYLILIIIIGFKTVGVSLLLVYFQSLSGKENTESEENKEN
jgi:heme/copper-type cytochrome/quinol oxidase subunit 4